MTRVPADLMEHQEVMLELMTDHDRFILGADCGTGKTLPTIKHCVNLLRNGSANSILICSTLKGLGAWTRDAALLSESAEKMFLDHVTLINYDKLSRKGKWQDMVDHDWDIIICDESHRIADSNAARTKFMVGDGDDKLGLASKTKYRYLLSGSILSNGKLEKLWAQLSFLFDKEYYNRWEFETRYTVKAQIPGTRKQFIVGYRRQNELSDKLAECSFRITKAECLDLPAVQDDIILRIPWSNAKNKAPFNATTQDIYNEAMEAYIDGIEMQIDNSLVRLLRMRQIAAGHIKESDYVTLTDEYKEKKHKGTVYQLHNAKIEAAMEWVEDNLPNKTVIFHEFKASGTAMCEALKKAKIPYLELNGASGNDTWKTFQSDESIKVIVCQYSSGSEAIDLYASSLTVFLEPTVKSVFYTQSRDRTNRKGQTASCQYVYLVTENSVEETVLETVKNHIDFEESFYRDVVIAQNRRE
jgi:SNF2 family DNA or RNA helicase